VTTPPFSKSKQKVAEAAAAGGKNAGRGRRAGGGAPEAALPLGLRRRVRPHVSARDAARVRRPVAPPGLRTQVNLNFCFSFDRAKILNFCFLKHLDDRPGVPAAAVRGGRHLLHHHHRRHPLIPGATLLLHRNLAGCFLTRAF